MELEGKFMMYNRAEVVDKAFIQRVRGQNWPTPRSATRRADVDLSGPELLDLFESQLISRHLDLTARKLKAQGECFYTIGSSGHEGNAVFGHVFRSTDMAFLHYRSGAHMVQRSKQLEGQTVVYDLMLSLVASEEDPVAGGRHKVFGSYDLLVPPQTSTIASHLPKAVGAALSIGRAKDLNLASRMPSDAVVVCSFGDASANHSTAQGAFNTAQWVAYQNISLPLVFICEDNGIGISVPTPENWLEKSFSQRPRLHYLACDGLNLFDVYQKAQMAEKWARRRREPVFLHMKTVRLLGHAGSDVETNYHSLSLIERQEAEDPLLHTAHSVASEGLLSPYEIVDFYESIKDRVHRVGQAATQRPKLKEAAKVKSTIEACRHKKVSPSLPSESTRRQIFGRDFEKMGNPTHMAKLVNWALHDLLLRYPEALVFGEDVAKKGGVYHVTDQLEERFGSRRVFNSLLDETNILGTAMGLAHNGFLPLPEIQFLAYVHNAEDQIRGEAATLAFFSQGQFTNPMVVRVAGLPYQKGFGGHFHNDNSLAVFRDIPGLIVAVPSHGADAVGMLRTCVRQAYENGRVCVFIEPIARYMTKDLHEEGDKGWSFAYPEVNSEVPLGEMAVWGEGKDLAIVTYGNGYYYSRQAAALLEKEGVALRIIDLRWVAPFDRSVFIEKVKGCQRLLIVDECRKTGSLAEGVVEALVEGLRPLPPVKVLAGEDCYIPLGVAAAAGLPSKDSILAASRELLSV